MPCSNSMQLVAFTRSARSTSLACISHDFFFSTMDVWSWRLWATSHHYSARGVSAHLYDILRIFSSSHLALRRSALTISSLASDYTHSASTTVELLDAGGLSSSPCSLLHSALGARMFVFMLDTAWIWICIMTRPGISLFQWREHF